jgi:hypothetical protein
MSGRGSREESRSETFLMTSAHFFTCKCRHPYQRPHPPRLPTGVITAMLRIKTFSPVRWCCLNGVLDSSGVGGCEIRRGLFARFPAVKAPSNSERSEDPVLSRATDFWFLCCEDEPVICLETSGRAYSTKGLMIELQPEYAKRRNIYDVVAEIHTRFLAGTAHLSI